MRVECTRTWRMFQVVFPWKMKSRINKFYSTFSIYFVMQTHALLACTSSTTLCICLHGSTIFSYRKLINIRKRTDSLSSSSSESEAGVRKSNSLAIDRGDRFRWDARGRVSREKREYKSVEDKRQENDHGAPMKKSDRENLPKHLKCVRFE